MKLKGMIVLLAITISIIIGTFSSFAYFSTKSQTLAVESASQDAVFYFELINTARNAQINFQRQVQEWKNILIRGNDRELYAKYLKSFTEREQDVQSGFSEVKKQLDTRQIPMATLDQLLTEHQKLGAKYREVLQGFKTEDPEAGKSVDLLLRGIDRPTSTAMDAVSKEIHDLSTKKLNETLQQSSSNSSDAVQILLLLALVSLALGVGFTLFVGFKIYTIFGGEPAEMSKFFTRLSQGDLSANFKVRAGDKDSLSAQAQVMQLRLRVLIGAIQSGSQELVDVEHNLEAHSSDLPKVKASIQAARLSVHGLDAAADRFKI